ncbi:TIGR03759 family integrating conjugative element protein [Klebsiella aerogenes]|uniref:TIGR03759 family integrating conjugative element protein n=1 Tax=Klebsiella aerogenes TaxID=548 RepID=A0AAP9R265_KLEAE|nr:TIGR03759 family integrating conjugative element protein [Klebsiella aerogenes]QMR42968.1 TIGR03759 family integrating conjugative element protein [Klebsiella aerogenes]
MKSRYGFLLLLSAITTAQGVEETNISESKSISVPLATTSPAQEWGLTSQEWPRYQQLKQGERGIWSPGLDPLTTLDVEAATEAERNHYAELLVEKESQRVDKELAFQRAYDTAWKRRLPVQTPVSAGNASPAVPADRRLTVFVRETCAACDSLVRTLLRAGNPLEIYLVDSGGDDMRLHRWGVTYHIDIARVKRRDITLNHDAGRWEHYGRGKMPAILEKQVAHGWT